MVAHTIYCKTQETREMAEETAQLKAIFSADAESRFVILFPAFRMGLKTDHYQRARNEGWFSFPSDVYYYRGLTSAVTAFDAVKGLVASLGRVFPADELQSRVVFATDDETELLHSERYTHYVLLGTRSQRFAHEILAQYSRDFVFRFDRDTWTVYDTREDMAYSVLNPTNQNRENPAPGYDYALIEKIIDPESRRVVLVIGGMWDTGTLAAGTFLVEHREEIYNRFGSSGFQYLLEIVAGSTLVNRIVLARAPRRGEQPGPALV